MFKRTKICGAALLAMGSLSSLPVAFAQEATQRVEITGSAVRRIDAEAALPVQVLNKQEIERIGAANTEALLQTVAALSSAGGTVNATGVGSSTYGNSTLSLRGLEEERTLVLVNGRRLANFADGSTAVNINSIPLAAIERIEILKDGASSIYGSDAIAGVVNFILRKDFSGVEIGAGVSSPTASGGGGTHRVSVTAGFGSGGLRGMVSASYEKEKALFGRDRKFSRTATVLPYYVSGATGQGNIEGAVNPGAYPNDRQAGFGTSPGTGYGNPLAATDKCEDINMRKNPTNTTKGAPYCIFDTGPFVGLMPNKELKSLIGNIAFQVNDSLEVFGDVIYSESMIQQTYQQAPLRRSFAAPSNLLLLGAGVDPSLIIFPSNPNYQIAADYLNANGFGSIVGQPLAVTARVFDFGGRQQTDTSKQTRLVAGARGAFGAHNYEVAAMFNESKVAGKYTGGVFSVTEYNRIINDPANNWNPWAPGGVQTGPLADKLKAAQYIGPSLDGKSTSKGIDAKLDGELFKLPAGGAMYALGLQARSENLVRDPAPKPGTGDIAGAGGAAFAIDKSRRVKAVFGELVMPIVKGAEATASVRSDRYSDFGTANTYKVGGLWRPNSSVLLRASHNTGFRAPSLPDLFQPQVLGTTEQFDDPATNQTDLQVTGVTGGNPDLKPEKSRAFSVGVVLSPMRELSIGVDMFRVKVQDIIQTPGAQEVVSRFRAGDAAYQSLVELSGNNIDLVRTVTSNLGKADVRGFDLFANYRHNLGAGRLDVSFNGTYMDRFNQTSPSGALSKKVGTIVEPDGTPVLGADEGGVVLRWKHALSFTYTLGHWSGTLTQNFNKGYRAGNDLNDNPTFIGDQSLFDLSVGYSGIKNLNLSVGVKNLLNTQPDIYVPVSNQFQSGYDVTQYDPRGRVVYVNATYKF